MSIEYNEEIVEKAARQIDPVAWMAYDRFLAWEENTGNVMPLDALDLVVSPSKIQARKILKTLA